MEPRQTQFSTVLENFLNYLSIERNFSLNTRDSYRNDLQRYLLAMEEECSSLETITPESINRFIDILHKTGLEASSIARNVSAIRSLHRFLLNDRVLETNPSENLHQPKQRKYLPSVLTLDETMRVLAAPLKRVPLGKLHLRDQAILELLYATGMRVSELVNLKQQSMYLEEQFIRVLGKGSKERLVPIGNSAVESLTLYRQKLRIQLAGAQSEDYLFLNARGKNMSRMAVFSIVKEYAMLAGIRKTSALTPFATHSQPICLKGVPTCAPCRKCLVTAPLLPHRFTPTLTALLLKRSTEAFIPEGKGTQPSNYHDFSWLSCSIFRAVSVRLTSSRKK